jgi:glycosyltransferase involved in cell wall biosynthesis
VTAVHQILPAALPHDAITGQAFAWRDLLRSWGHESKILAPYVHPDLTGIAFELDRSGKRFVNEGGVVLHYAVWSETVEVALEAKGPVALCYHNITPGELLRPFSPTAADLCDRGRAALVPLLLELPAEVPRRNPSREPVVLAVGRIVPNKRLEDVVKAFTLYQCHHAPDASLFIVGSDLGFENYRQALDVLVARCGARGVHFTGQISADARNALYFRADVYLSMSAHEGFCAPLIEALAHGVPVVARGAGAVPETLGGAGLVLEGADLPLVAEALHELASSRSTRSALYDTADRRLAELRPDLLVPRVRSALGPLLNHRDHL